MRFGASSNRSTGTRRLDVVVLDAAERASLVCVRSLGRTGHRVGAFDVHRAPAFSSRWSATSGMLPHYAVDQTAFADAVVELATLTAPAALLTVHEGSIEALRPRRAELEQLSSLALAPEDALEPAIDKRRTCAVAAALGVPLPRMVPVADGREVDAALAETGLPAVVKPVRSWVRSAEGSGSRLRSVLVRSPGEARAAVADARGAGGEVVVQEWIPGRREAVWLFRAEGHYWARFAQVAHRMLPPLGGSSIVRESIPLPGDAVEAAEAIIDAIGLDGFAEVEFRRDRRARPVLMEVNPRLSASIELAERSGADFPGLLFAWAAGRPLVPQHAYRTGVRMRWLGGDIRWLASTLGTATGPDVPSPQRAFATFALDCFRPAAYDYLTRSDLRPAAVATTDFFVRGAGALGKVVSAKACNRPSSPA